MGKNKSYSRRDFLKASTLASSAFLLSNCTSVQGTFSGDKRNLDNEVLILGAGLAGLTAAYVLKKNRVPYRIFEASPRIGGRIYTLQNFSAGGVFAELGGEYFDENHRRTFQLCKELGVQTQELKNDSKLEDRLYSVRGQLYSQSEYRKKIKPLYAQLAKHYGELFFNRDIVLTVDNMSQYEKALYYDSLTAEDFIRSFSTDVDAWVLDIFLLQVRTRFGVEPKLLSALQLITTFSKDPLLNFQGTRAFHRVNGGNAQLTQVLYDRVAGVIPDFIVKVDSALQAIKKKTNGFELEFKVGGKSRTYLAKQIICTIPFSCLRDVEGIDKLDFSAAKQDLIRNQVYAGQTKSVLEVNEKFWLKKTAQHPSFSGDISGDFTSQYFYDGSFGQSGDKFLLSSLRANRSEDTQGENFIMKALEDIEKIHPGSRNLFTNNQNFMRWGDRAWSKGSRSIFAPMQYYKFSGVAAKQEADGNFLFAGEHTSIEYQGTMEGAISTGSFAAETFVKKSNS